MLLVFHVVTNAFDYQVDVGRKEQQDRSNIQRISCGQLNEFITYSRTLLLLSQGRVVQMLPRPLGKIDDGRLEPDFAPLRMSVVSSVGSRNSFSDTTIIL